MLYVTDCPAERGVELLPTEWSPIEEALSERLSRLDVDAWETLYVEHRRLIRGVLAGQLGYGAELEDVTQQVFETAIGLVETGKVRLTGERSGMRAWLVAIALRLAQSERRRRRRATSAEPSSACERLTSSAIDPAGWQLLQHTQALVAKFPPRLRIPWLLRHLEGMQLEEIAESCGISLATVKRRLSRAQRLFSSLAARDSVLSEHLNGGEAQ